MSAVVRCLGNTPSSTQASPPPKSTIAPQGSIQLESGLLHGNQDIQLALDPTTTSPLTTTFVSAVVRCAGNTPSSTQTSPPRKSTIPPRGSIQLENGLLHGNQDIQLVLDPPTTSPLTATFVSAVVRCLGNTPSATQASPPLKSTIPPRGSIQLENSLLHGNQDIHLALDPTTTSPLTATFVSAVVRRKGNTPSSTQASPPPKSTIAPRGSIQLENGLLHGNQHIQLALDP